jgi:thioredoxin 1
MIEATDSNFYGLVFEGLYLVDFYSSTCGPCKTLGMILANAEGEIEEMGLKIIKVNTTDCIKVADEMDISSVPEVHIVKDGERIGGFVGMRTKKQIMEIIKDSIR